MSERVDVLGARIAKQYPATNDFTLLRDKPLFQEANLFFPFDFSVLAEKLASGPFWAIHGNLPDGRTRERFHSFWGNIFESYMNWLLEESTNGNANRFHPNPCYAGRPNDQVCDGVVVCGQCVVLIEYKGNTFTAKSKYGDDLQLFEQELRKKLVGSPSSRKGVFQLVDAIGKLFSRSAPERVEGLDLSRMTTVFPLLITREDVGSMWGINAFLNDKFQENIERKKLSCSVAPLSCFTVHDAEKLSPDLYDIGLADILAERLRLDKKGKKEIGS